MKKAIYLLAIILFCAASLSAQSKLSINLGGAYCSPTGDFGDLYKSGLGGLVKLNYKLNDNFHLSLTAGYEQFSFNNEKFNELLNEFFSSFDESFNVNVDSKLQIIPVMIGGKYYFTNAKFKPYASLDLGLHRISADGSKIQVNGETLNAVKSESKTTFAWAFAAGFLYGLGSGINLDINAGLNGNNLEMGTNFETSGSGYSSSQSSKSTIAYFAFGAGLVFEL